MFGKNVYFIIHQKQPLNGGPPLKLLRQNFITPYDLFFVRNHGTIPDVYAESYRLSINGLVRKPVQLSLQQLRENFPSTSTVATLQCAGNRRQELANIEEIAGELPWSEDAISNGEWRGVLLRDILQSLEIEPGARHIDFTGVDEIQKNAKIIHFGGSIPIETALGPDVLLAYEMNGKTLLPAHGYPLRVVVPGYIGARSVKWLGQITLQENPSTNYFQAHAYKLFSPQVRAENADWEKGIMLGETSVTSVICAPNEGERIAEGAVKIQGYAMAGGRRCVERVDVSIDGGQSWLEAELPAKRSPVIWSFWEITLNLGAGSYQVAVRAVDSAANTQPEDVKNLWNFKGYMNNAWHRVNFTVG
ncbi:MAG: molybdopterin-dependent oxidoreductase [Chloroflexi bacterium]|nr:molybdopterin-dependent oxidoreductase [Chloroflexota bacterium]